MFKSLGLPEIIVSSQYQVVASQDLSPLQSLDQPKIISLIYHILHSCQ